MQSSGDVGLSKDIMCDFMGKMGVKWVGEVLITTRAAGSEQESVRHPACIIVFGSWEAAL